jgi:hypothetical protein
MMAEMIANYSAPGAKPAVPATAEGGGVGRDVTPASKGSGYLNEVRPLNAREA